MTDLSDERTSFELFRFVLMFSALYVAFGVASPFVPAFLASRGLSPQQIGLLLSLAGMVRLASGPIVGRLADRLHAARSLLAICTLTAGIAALGFVPASAFSVLLAVSLLHAALLAPTTSLADALALRDAARTEHSQPRFEYGWVRGTGSAAFIVGSLVAGQVLNAMPPASALIGQAVFLVLAAGAALLVPEIVADRQSSRSGANTAMPGLAGFAFNRPFRRLVLVAAIILGSHAMHDSFAMISWNAARISPGVGSVLWSESVAAEVVVFLLVGPWLLRRLSAVNAMRISAAAAVLRWTVMSQSSSVVALALVEPLHGLTFALLHLSCMRILVRITPAETAATAQAIYAFAIGASAAVLTFAAGILYADFGSAGFAVMAALAAASLPAIWALSRALAVCPQNTE